MLVFCWQFDPGNNIECFNLTSQESGVVIDMSMKQPFLELNRILEALRTQDLRPALEYVAHLSAFYWPLLFFILSSCTLPFKSLGYGKNGKNITQYYWFYSIFDLTPNFCMVVYLYISSQSLNIPWIPWEHWIGRGVTSIVFVDFRLVVLMVILVVWLLW